MAPLASLSMLLTSIASLVAGHGYLKSITINGQNYLAWQVGQDDYVTPPPTRYARKLANNGPVPDFTAKDITYVAVQLTPITQRQLIKTELVAAQVGIFRLGG